MKRTSLFTALIALALPVMQAATPDCATNFGLNRAILAKKATKATPAPAKPVKATAEKAEVPKEEAAKDADTPKDGEEPKAKDETPAAKDAEAPKEVKPAVDPDQQIKDSNNKLLNECRRLRKRMEEAETELAKITKPSRGLVSRCNTTKTYVTSKLESLEETAVEAAALQAKCGENAGKDYQFTICTSDQRDKYVQDATAAYKAMVNDVNQKKKSRKIRGLDKFEVLRERYQGIPEYKEADAWYEKTLKDLEKSWTKMKNAEEKKREKLQSAKRQKMEEDDDKVFEKVEKQLKEEGEDIAKVWYNPEPRNMRMLTNCINKVNDALRRRGNGDERNKEYIGCVPGLLTKFWEGMDKARERLVAGDLETARELLDDDDAFNRIIRLPRNVMPDEYKEPLREQRQHMIREIKNRETENSRNSRELERKLSSLERDSANIEARIDNLMEEIEREQASDVGESTVKVDKDKPAKEEEATEDGEKPAEGAEAKDGEKKGEGKSADKPKDKPKKTGKPKNSKPKKS